MPEEKEGRFDVYNFEVEQTHSYYVSSSVDGALVLVHNASCGDIVNGIRRPGAYNTKVGSLEEALSHVEEALPNARRLPDARPGADYGRAPRDVRSWYRVEPAEPGVGNDLPHVKYADWTNGKKRSGGSWGHIFFPEE